MDIVISSEHNGTVLLGYLRGVVGISRAMLVKLKKDEKGILLNGRHVTVRAVLSEGDVLSLATEDSLEDENPYLEAVPHPIEILDEDNEVVALNKKAGMVTHTTHGHYGDSIANALYAKYKSEGRVFIFRAVNRLDRETSGAVLVSKDKLSAYKLSGALKCGEIEKKYVAVVCGRLEGDGEITGYICRCGDSIITRRVCEGTEDGASYAHTVYRSLFASERYSVVLAEPITGRTHQLRVHFASIGHPIVGDSLYGSGCVEISRQALHAAIMGFPLPGSGERKRIYAPVPSDIRTLCDSICYRTLEKDIGADF